MSSYRPPPWEAPKYANAAADMNNNDKFTSAPADGNGTSDLQNFFNHANVVE